MSGMYATLTNNLAALLRSYRLVAGLMLMCVINACTTLPGEQAVTAGAVRGIAIVPLVDGDTRIDIATDSAFDFGRAELLPAFAKRLATVVKPYQQDSVQVSAYTDNVGAAAFNLDLSQRRAHAIADVLHEQGFSKAQLTVSGYGDANPVASNATETGRRLNRRIELLITAKVP